MRTRKLCASLLVVSLCAGLAPVSGTEAAKADVSLSKTNANLTIREQAGKTAYGTTKIKVRAAKGVKVKKITFKSANSKVVAVNKKGKVTAKNVGSAKIKVAVKYTKKKKNLKKMLTFKVTVKKSGDSAAGIAVPTAEVPVATVNNNTGGNPVPVSSDAPEEDPEPSDAPEEDPWKGDISLDEMSWEDLVKSGAIVMEGTVIKKMEGNCYGNLVIPDGVTAIEDSAFYGHENLTGVTIPDSVTKIGNDAFATCGLKSVRLSENLKTIEENVFASNPYLKEITIPDSVTCIEVNAFWQSGLTSLTIPENVTKIGHHIMLECRSLEKIVVSADNPVYDSRDNCNAIIEKERNALIQGCKNTIIPNSVTCIDYAAFAGCYDLESIEIPDGVESIGDYAFLWCESLRSITISESVTSIGNVAFSGCSGLTGITIPEGVTRIGEYAFAAI